MSHLPSRPESEKYYEPIDDFFYNALNQSPFTNSDFIQKYQDFLQDSVFGGKPSRKGRKEKRKIIDDLTHGGPFSIMKNVGLDKASSGGSVPDQFERQFYEKINEIVGEPVDEFSPVKIPFLKKTIIRNALTTGLQDFYKEYTLKILKPQQDRFNEILDTLNGELFGPKGSHIIGTAQLEDYQVYLTKIAETLPNGNDKDEFKSWIERQSLDVLKNETPKIAKNFFAQAVRNYETAAKYDRGILVEVVGLNNKSTYEKLVQAAKDLNLVIQAGTVKAAVPAAAATPPGAAPLAATSAAASQKPQVNESTAKLDEKLSLDAATKPDTGPTSPKAGTEPAGIPVEEEERKADFDEFDEIETPEDVAAPVEGKRKKEPEKIEEPVEEETEKIEEPGKKVESVQKEEPIKKEEPASPPARHAGPATAPKPFDDMLATRAKAIQQDTKDIEEHSEKLRAGAPRRSSFVGYGKPPCNIETPAQTLTAEKWKEIQDMIKEKYKDVKVTENRIISKQTVLEKTKQSSLMATTLAKKPADPDLKDLAEKFKASVKLLGNVEVNLKGANFEQAKVILFVLIQPPDQIKAKVTEGVKAEIIADAEKDDVSKQILDFLELSKPTPAETLDETSKGSSPKAKT